MKNQFIDNYKTNNHKGECYIPWTKTLIPSKTSIDGYSRSYNVLDDEISYCCEKMEKNMGRHEYYPIYLTLENSPTEYCATIMSSPESHDGIVDVSTTEINFCPFCGKPIKTECVKTFKKVLKECKEVIKKEPVYETKEVI